MKEKETDDNKPIRKCPPTKLIYSDESGYMEITENGVIGTGSGKWPGGDVSDQIPGQGDQG